MRSPFILLILVGIFAAGNSDDDNHGWVLGTEYQYLVRSRTVTGLDTLDEQYTGVLMKAILKMQYTSADTFRLKLVNPQYAKIHKTLPDGWDSYISDQMLEYEDLPLSDEPFVLKLKHKVFRELIVNANLQTWEVNIIKSIVSQLQADTQGENVKRSKGVQIPENRNPFATFHSMEDSISGKCEVLYDIVPLAEHVINDRPELLPNPEIRGKEELFYITKTKNYERCDQRVDYYFGISINRNWEYDIRNNDQIIRKSSMSYMVLSGTLKDFIVQSAVTTTKIIMKPRLADEQESVVMSKMNVTLVNAQKIKNHLPEPSRPVSTGNLVYSFNDPFSENELRRSGEPNESFDSMSNEMDSNSESNEELRFMREQYDRRFRTNVVSDEDKRYRQIKPTLQDAPKNPFLPLFIGNKGKAVLLSDKTDSIKMVSMLVDEIVNEIENPNTMPEQETLEKFTILCRLISSMSLEQINKVERNLYSVLNEISSERNQIKKENTRALFRDVIASAGTGPALMTIKRWIEEKQIEGFEAATVVSTIPNTARIPTAEYVDVLFKMASNPEIQKQMYLNSSVVLSLAELVHLTQVSNNSMFNYYPVNIFGRLSSRQNDAVVRKYIPFLAEQLRKAIKDGDSSRIQVYIIALGITGHPKILSVFEPYLEGKERMSNFQRFLMVMSLKKLTNIKPSLARSVLYKIYLNTWDVYHIRCAAVYLLMNTNPPLDMLTRMAQFTNYDYSKQVNSAVKSSIENAANLMYPEWQELASNARKVFHLLNPADNEYYYSKNYLMEAEINDQISYKVLMNYIGSEDSIIPMSMFLAVKPSYNDFLASTYALSLSVSSVRSLLGMYWEKYKSREKNVESLTEKVAKMLNIESDDIEQVEGMLFYKTPYLNTYLSFDNHSIEGVLRNLKSSKHSGRVNINKWLSNDIVLSFPTETGLPFVYALQKPILFKLSGTTKPDIKSGFDVRLLMSTKHQGKIGFVTPFDHQAFVSGISGNYQIFLPFRLNYNVNLEKSRIDLTLRPSERDANMIRLGHFCEVPYTSQYDLLSLRPLLLDKNTHRVETKKPEKIRIPKNPNSVFAVEVESDNLIENLQEWLENDKWDDIPTTLLSTRGTYEKIDLYIKPNLQESEAIKLFVVLDTMEIRSQNDNSDKESWQSDNKEAFTDQHTLDSSARRKNFLLQVSKGMNSGDAFVVDAGLEIPGAWDSSHVLTWCLATSNIENKHQTLLYMHTNFPKYEVTYEICANTQMKSSAMAPFDYQKILNDDPTKEFSLNIRVGETCSEGIHIAIKGKLKQTEDYKEYVQKSLMAKKCKENHLNKIRDCQEVINMASDLNEIDMTISFDSKEHNNALDTNFNNVLDTIKKSKKLLGTSNMEFQEESNDNKGNEVRIQIKLSPDLTNADGTISTSGTTLTFSNFEMSQLWDNIDMNKDENNITGLTATCTLGNDEAVTFDGKTYSLQLGKCPHVLLTTFPERNPDKFNELRDIPEHMKLSIIAQETENNKKEVRVQMGNDEVLLRPSDMELKVMVNGQKVRYSQVQSYQHVKNDKIVFQIYKLPGPALKLLSDKYDLDLVYDGNRVLIEVPYTYRKSIRGLCGDYDGRPENDLVTPKNCMLQEPKEFTSTWILKEQCEGNALKYAKKAQFSKCITKDIRFSDVVSDEEAGRAFTNWKEWGYRKKDIKNHCLSHRTGVISKENKICFTMRPVPICTSGCKPNGTKQKKYDLYCLPQNEQGLGMKKRVEQGANPDLSQRTPSSTEMFTVPMECVAA